MMLAGLRAGGASLGRSQALVLSARGLAAGAQKTEMMQNLWNIKRKKPTNLDVITVQSDGLEESKSQLIMLKPHHIHLDRPSGETVTNPADIIPSVLTQFKCNVCGRVYKNSNYLRNHLKKSSNCAALTAKLPNQVHLPDPVVAAPSGPQVCGDCNKTFGSEAKLERHKLRSKESGTSCADRHKLRSKQREGKEILKSKSKSVQTMEELLQEEELLEEARKAIQALGGKDYSSKIRREVKVREVKVREEKINKSCEYCQKLFRTQKGFDNHEAKGCKKRPLSPEELAAKAAAEEAERLERFKDELIATRRPILAAYFDILVNTNRAEVAYEDLKRLRSKPELKAVVEDMQLYDIILRGFARRSKMREVQEVWQDMTSGGLAPTVESYISALMCFSKVDGNRDMFHAIAHEIFTEFQQAGYTVGQALETGAFEYDDKKQLLETLTGLLGLGGEQMETSQRVTHQLLAEAYREGSDMLESQIDGVLDRSELDPLVTKQVENELRGVVQVSSIYRTQENEKVAKKCKAFTDSLEKEWRKKVALSIEKRVNYERVVDRGETINMQEFLACVPIPKLVDIVIAQAKLICTNSETFSEPCNWISAVLGEQVMEAYFIQNKTQNDARFWRDMTWSFSSYLDWYSSPQEGPATHREAMEALSADFKLDRPRVQWPGSVKLAVGKELFHVLIRDMTFNTDRGRNVIVDGKRLDHRGKLQEPMGKVRETPAFFKIFRNRKLQDVEEAKPHPSIWNMYEMNNKVEMEFRSIDVPMLCPPLPWVSSNTGAYVALNSQLIRIPPGTVGNQLERIGAQPAGSLDPVLDSVNQLSSMPWRVNKVLLNLAIEIFKSEDNALKQSLDIPVHVDSIERPRQSADISATLSKDKQLTMEQRFEYSNFVKEKQIYDHFKAHSYSVWCDLLYRLSLANHFKDEILWFPHNLDFRGRAYPLAPLLNHMGSDLPRSLLGFAKGKPLGSEGFGWLKLHCINLTGLKKRESVAARMAAAEELLPEMLDSAARPTSGRRWWLDSDAPWQTLATCQEVAAALACPGGPSLFVSHLPIHQDGSCNGLQHYAALGRDSLGAKAVNLVPAVVPGDVYSDIAAIVEEKRKNDASTGNLIAASLDGFIRRKVVKQTVMTTVYGVTRYGATKQIARQLHDLEGTAEGDFQGHVDGSSKYLSAKTFESLNELFTASQEIQNWLTECANVIAGDNKENVTWVTPLGLPVVQPYSYLHAPKKGWGGITYEMNHLHKLPPGEVPVLKVSRMKHRNAFPPNFIHSLDSSHMMLTSLHLWTKGVTFASVHDCYWTHACDVPTMNRVCRDQFIALHSSPILEDLASYFVQHHMGSRPLVEVPENKRDMEKINEHKRMMLYRQVPEKGDLDLNVIRDSTFFFS